MSDLWIAYLGYWKNENLRSRVSWETSRYVSFVTLKSAGDKRLKKPTDLMRFPWEDIISKTTWTKEKLQAMKKLKPNWFNE